MPEPGKSAGGSTFVDVDREMARRVADYWFAFARGGKPSPAGATAWPQYHANNDKTMEFGNTIAVCTNFMEARLRAFTGVLNVAGKLLDRN
ncbi:MAG: carboxylesterase family protein [Gemmatimonadaceae bacterium]